ncbi:uncharacterized protein PAC_07375 [Phialocephala subalpina]|uniref:Uncharacterized protein n=1 Tax=Phialocephala subalpina TaxID=576137 RepID=A0A1L7WXJ1_9HELO|nr:uncharacterized protein PAC_07375 [Phialocephala subalpina]
MPAKKITKPTPPPVTFKSTEYIQESDEEEEDKSDDASDSDEDSLPENPTNATTKINGKLPAPSGSESSSESESSSDESSEEEDEQNNTVRKFPVESEPSRQRPKEPEARTVAFEKAAPYKPPTGFEATSINGNTTASELLKKSNLKGKQVWYFTAPASIHISDIEQMSMLDADNGEAILNHKGSDYGFVKDTTGDKIYTKIMVPNDSDDAYLTASKPIDRILHLQQIVTLPGINASGATVPAKKPIRPQPKGLKMHFRPIGFGKGETGHIGDGSESASDEEMEDAPAVFRRPVLEDAEMEDAEMEDAEMEDAPPPSSRSKSKSKSTDTPQKEKKRKHTEEGSQPVKQSSSQPTNDIDDRELKRWEKKQKKSTSRADSQSTSTEALDAATKSLSQKAKHAALMPNTKPSPIRSKSSQPLEVKGSQESRSLSQKHSKKRSHNSEKASEEHKKSKKLKHKDSE